MTSMAGDYRKSPIWKQTRHLVLALSLAADSFSPSGKNFSERIRKNSIDLLLKIIELCESRTDPGGVRRSLEGLNQALSESRTQGFLTKPAFHHLEREIRGIQSALAESPWKGRAGSGSGPETPGASGKLSFSSPTGVYS